MPWFQEDALFCGDKSYAVVTAPRIRQQEGSDDTGILPAGGRVPRDFQQQLKTFCGHVERRMLQKDTGRMTDPDIAAVRFIQIGYSESVRRWLVLSHEH